MAINEKVQKVADKLKDQLVFNGDTQKIELSSDAVAKGYEALNEQGIEVTREQADKVMEGFRVFNAAAALVTGEVALDAMSKNDGIDNLSAEWEYAKGLTTTHTIERTATVRAPGKEEEITRYGRLSSAVQVDGSKAGKSPLSPVRDYLYNKGEEMFGKKD